MAINCVALEDCNLQATAKQTLNRLQPSLKQMLTFSKGLRSIIASNTLQFMAHNHLGLNKNKTSLLLERRLYIMC